MKNRRKVISWILLISWMLLIFFMSHQSGDVSSKQSDLLIKLLSLIGLDLNSYLGNIASFIIRKIAHFTEYFILYILIINVLNNYFKTTKARLAALLIVLCYAITDEVHQYFVPGRAMALTDMLIDFSGGIFAFISDIIYHKVKNLKFKNKP